MSDVVVLTKGENVNLSKAAPNLTHIEVGLGWNPRTTDGKPFDLDASAFLLTQAGKVQNAKGFVYFRNLKDPSGSVAHQGDNLTGVGDGDDEVIKVALNQVPAEITTIAFTVTIYEADVRQQNFGQVDGAYIRIVNAADHSEIARYDLREDAGGLNAVIFGEVYRLGSEWKFRAVGQGSKAGLAGLATSYGLSVG